MASLTQWTWVWVNSGSWWWTGRPGVLQSMGSQRVRHDWVTELTWTVSLPIAIFFENTFSFSLKFATGINSLVVSWECRLLLDTMSAGYTELTLYIDRLGIYKKKFIRARKIKRHKQRKITKHRSESHVCGVISNKQSLPLNLQSKTNICMLYFFYCFVLFIKLW